MPSEMFERGRRDAEADALDENYYQYYYEYKQGYDQVVRNRRRSRRQRVLRRVGRGSLWALPLILILGALGLAGYRYLDPLDRRSAAASPTPTRTPRPTLVPPTPRPLETPTVALALRTDSFAVITGTQGAPLRARAAPGTETNNVIARFREGQTVKLIDGPRDASGMTWWKIEGDGKSGWASATYLQPVLPPP